MTVDDWAPTRIGEIAWEVSDKSRGSEEVLSCTKHRGFVPSLEYFGKQVFSKETDTYKLVRRGQFAYATIHLDEGSIDCLTIRDEGIISPMYTVFDVDDTRVDRDFLLELLQTPAMLDRYNAIGQGSINRRKSISFDTLALETIQLPPLPEQKKIAVILASVDDAIQATEAVIEQTQRVKEGLYERFFRDASYPLRRISDVGDAQLGQQRHPKFATGVNVRPYLRVANVLDGKINFDDLNKMHFPEESLGKFELLAGDILLNEGQSVHLVGRSAMYRGEVPGLCVQKTLLRYRCGPRLDPDFAQAVFQHWLWTGHFADVAVQTTSMAHLTGIRFNRMKIPVPSLAEQRSIAARVNAVNETLAAHRRALEAHATTKAGLLQDLLTGAVRLSV